MLPEPLALSVTMFVANEPIGAPMSTAPVTDGVPALMRILLAAVNGTKFSTLPPTLLRTIEPSFAATAEETLSVPLTPLAVAPPIVNKVELLDCKLICPPGPLPTPLADSEPLTTRVPAADLPLVKL